MKAIPFIILVLFPFSFIPQASANHDVVMDSLFGVAGYVRLDNGFTSENLSVVRIDSRGFIVAAGTFKDGSDSSLFIVRMDGQGNLDPLFGTGGIVTFAHAGFDTDINDLIITAAGRIVVTGRLSNADVDKAFFSMFDSVGEYVRENTIDAEPGKLVYEVGVRLSDIGSFIYLFGNVGTDLLTARFDSITGAPDLTFGDLDGEEVPKGYKVRSLGWPIYDCAQSGKIHFCGGGNSDFKVIRIESGEIDSTFAGGTGEAVINLDGAALYIEKVKALMVGPEGGITIAGNSDGIDVVIARFDENGLMKKGFGSGGYTSLELGDYAYSVADMSFDAHGNIVVLAYEISDQEYVHPVLIQYTGFGVLDTVHFGSIGYVKFADWGTGDGYKVNSMVLDGSQRIVVVGMADNNYSLMRVKVVNFNVAPINPNFPNIPIILFSP